MRSGGWIISVGGLVLLIGASIIAQEIGGIAARVGGDGVAVNLVVSEPLVRCVSNRIEWQGDFLQEPVAVKVKLDEGVKELARVNGTVGSVPVVIPEEVTSPVGIFLTKLNGEVLANRTFDALPAGQDCF